MRQVLKCHVCRLRIEPKPLKYNKLHPKYEPKKITVFTVFMAEDFLGEDRTYAATYER